MTVPDRVSERYNAHARVLQFFAKRLIDRPVELSIPFPLDMTILPLMDLLTSHLEGNEKYCIWADMATDTEHPERAKEADRLFYVKNSHDPISEKDKREFAALDKEIERRRILPRLKETVTIIATGELPDGRKAEPKDLRLAEARLRSQTIHSIKLLRRIQKDCENAIIIANTPDKPPSKNRPLSVKKAGEKVANQIVAAQQAEIHKWVADEGLYQLDTLRSILQGERLR